MIQAQVVGDDQGRTRPYLPERDAHFIFSSCEPQVAMRDLHASNDTDQARWAEEKLISLSAGQNRQS